MRAIEAITDGVFPHSDLGRMHVFVDPAAARSQVETARQAVQPAAQAVIDSAPDTRDPLTEQEVAAALEALRELPERLDDADTELRADVYRSLGITLTYRREDGAEYVRVQAALNGVDLERVGGAFAPMRTRIELG